MDYCEFSQLVQNNKQGGNSLSSRMCFNHIGSITKCLTDGRDHMPCCVAAHIPKVCQPICQGNFSLTGNINFKTIPLLDAFQTIFQNFIFTYLCSFQ